MSYIGGDGGQGFALNGVQIGGHDPAVFRQRVSGDVCPGNPIPVFAAQNLHRCTGFQCGKNGAGAAGFTAHIQRTVDNSGGAFYQGLGHIGERGFVLGQSGENPAAFRQCVRSDVCPSAFIVELDFRLM